MTLEKLLRKCNIFNNSIFNHTNNDIIENVDITNIEFDSRKIKAGNLFIAIKGFTTDGHQYIKTAFENGASACIIDENREELLKKE